MAYLQDAVLAALLSLLGFGLATVIWQWLDTLVSLFLEALAVLQQSLPMLLLPFPTLPWFVLYFAIAGVSCLLLPRGFPGRYLGVLLLLPAFLFKPATPAEGELRLTLIDVGQGLAVLLEAGDVALLYDTGPAYREGSNSAESIILPLLRQRGIASLDTLVLSHFDNDHAGGWQSVIFHKPPQRLLIGQTVEELLMMAKQTAATNLDEVLPTRVSSCHRLSPWQWRGLTLQFLSIGEHWRMGRSSNNRSCVLKITVAGRHILIAGDIEAAVERALVDRYGSLLRSDILVVPHHGSISSSSWPFIKTVAAKYALVSSAYRNQFGHPHPQALRRYQILGTRVINTGSSGAIEIRIGSTGLIALSSYSDKRQPYWLRGLPGP